MTYRQLTRLLETIYDRLEAQAVADLLLEERYALSRTDSLCGGVEALSEADGKRLEADVRRLTGGEPVQYVLGRASFCGRSFAVEPGVLIPRPETEELCRMVESHFTNVLDRPIDILDVGTGSGCIALTMALDVAGSRVTAIDLSETALRVASNNARQLGATVSFVKADALALPTEDSPKWNAIVSNPPYICLSEREAMHSNVADHEPQEALFVADSDPLLFYRAIAAYAVSALRSGGLLAFELNPLHAEKTALMVNSMGCFASVSLHSDAYGKLRMMTATKK